MEAVSVFPDIQGRSVNLRMFAQQGRVKMMVPAIRYSTGVTVCLVLKEARAR